MAPGGFGQFSDEIHGHISPFALGNGEGLEETWGASKDGFIPLALVTTPDVASYICFQARPCESLFETPNSLVNPLVGTQRGIMEFLNRGTA